MNVDCSLNSSLKELLTPLLGENASEETALALLTALWARYASPYEQPYALERHEALLRLIIQTPALLRI